MLLRKYKLRNSRPGLNPIQADSSFRQRLMIQTVLPV